MAGAVDNFVSVESSEFNTLVNRAVRSRTTPVEASASSSPVSDRRARDRGGEIYVVGPGQALVYDVRAEEECGSDGEPNRPAAILQDVVEEVVVDHVQGSQTRSAITQEETCDPQKQESSFKRPPSPGGIRDASHRAHTSSQCGNPLSACVYTSSTRGCRAGSYPPKWRLRGFALVFRTEVEQVEQVADGRHVARHVMLVTALSGIGQVIAAAVAEGGIEHPVPFDELHEGGMLAIDVADMTASREG